MADSDSCNFLAIPYEQRKAAALSAISKLELVRESLTGAESLYIKQVTEAVKWIRNLSRMSDEQREEAVLRSIECQGATTVNEIAEDCRLDRGLTKATLDTLVDRGDIYRVRKFAVGTDRPVFMYKSNREKVPEAGGQVLTQGHSSIYSPDAWET